ncbi:MAG: hypothetical protein ACHQF3_00090 [Alphaproteobacteria bacterium]
MLSELIELEDARQRRARSAPASGLPFGCLGALLASHPTPGLAVVHTIMSRPMIFAAARAAMLRTFDLHHPVVAMAIREAAGERPSTALPWPPAHASANYQGDQK